MGNGGRPPFATAFIFDSARIYPASGIGNPKKQSRKQKLKTVGGGQSSDAAQTKSGQNARRAATATAPSDGRLISAFWLFAWGAR